MILYQIALAARTCGLIGGGLTLTSHVTGQLSEGAASAESLVGGVTALALGLLFCLLGDIGQRLVRLEHSTRWDQNELTDSEA